MDRLQAMQVFTKVVELNGFAKAADALDLPRASASTIIKNLEAHLRVRLMQRTTRRLSLTPEGAEYYERCARILAEIEETEETLANSERGPRGKLRVDMSSSVGRALVMPHMSAFRQAYPDIEITLSFTDKPIDLIQEGVDCAIRVGVLEDSSLVARRLGDLRTITAASPAYIRRHGSPQSIADLQGHFAVQFFSNGAGRLTPYTFVVDGSPIELKLPGTLSVNDADIYVMCGVQGEGIVQAPLFMLLPFLESGELIEILPNSKPRPMPISAVYPHNRHLAPKVRVFVEWVADLFKHSPLIGDDAVRTVASISSEALTQRVPRHLPVSSDNLLATEESK